MIKTLLSHDNPHNGTRLFEALSKEGCKVATMDNRLLSVRSKCHIKSVAAVHR